MPTGFAFRTAVLAACLSVAWLGSAAADAADERRFTAERLADGLHLFRVPPTDLEHTNSLVIEREAGLVVVESQPSPEAAERFLTELRLHLDAPIRYLVLGHAHTESAGGASAFPSSTTVVASRGCARALADPEFDAGAEVRRRIGDDWKEPPRARPELVIHALTELDDPRMPIHLMPLPPGHSTGDLAVVLPSQKIAYVGSTLFARDNPYPGGGRIAAWIGALNQLYRTEWTTYIPLRGSTLDKAAVNRDRDSLAWLRGQVSLAFAEGIEPDAMAEYLATRPDTPKYFSPSSEPSFLRLFTGQAVEETIDERRKRGWRD